MYFHKFSVFENFKKVFKKSFKSPWILHKLACMNLGNSTHIWGTQWLSGRVLDSRPRGCGFEPQQRHCIVSLNKKINPSLVLVQPKKTRPFITERLLMGPKESNQTNTHIWEKWTHNLHLYWSYLLPALEIFMLSNEVSGEPLQMRRGDRAFTAMHTPMGLVGRKPVFGVSDKASLKPFS